MKDNIKIGFFVLPDPEDQEELERIKSDPKCDIIYQKENFSVKQNTVSIYIEYIQRDL